jgi:hypothetical protein
VRVASVAVDDEGFGLEQKYVHECCFDLIFYTVKNILYSSAFK